MIRLLRSIIFNVTMLWLFVVSSSVHGAILYFDIPDVVLIPPAQGSVSTGIDFLLSGTDDFLLTLTRQDIPAGNTQTTLNLGGTFPMATVFVDPDAGGTGVHHLTKFFSGDSIGTPQNDIRRNAGLAFQMTLPAGTYTGQWGQQPEIAFAGIAIDGFAGPNFGWARIGVDHGSSGADTMVTLFDFAVEGVPHRPITAGAVPEPGVTLLGIVALGWFCGVGRRR